jgi:hypothetical protein
MTTIRRVALAPACIGVIVTALPVATPVAQALEPIPVISYDISSTPPSGWGGWAHTYDGTIASTGRIADSNTCGGALSPAEIYSYSGGSGTLNDGVGEAANIDTTHLLCLGLDTAGAPVAPMITLHFGQQVLIERITVFGGGTIANIYPGSLVAADVTIGGTSVDLTSQPSPPDGSGQERNDIFDLTSTPLAQIPTDRVVLSDLRAACCSGFQLTQTAIAEITVEGTVDGGVAVPVGLDIRPGTRRNVVDLDRRAPVPFALLSSADFDPGSVDVDSLRFGRTGDEDSVIGCGLVVDLNRDRRRDLLCLFEVRRTGFQLGDTVGVLTGRTSIGTAIEGVDDIIVRA